MAKGSDHLIPALLTFLECEALLATRKNCMDVSRLRKTTVYISFPRSKNRLFLHTQSQHFLLVLLGFNSLLKIWLGHRQFKNQRASTRDPELRCCSVSVEYSSLRRKKLLYVASVTLPFASFLSSPFHE